jgi:hypothetical protein
MKNIFLIVPCLALSLFLAHCTDDDSSSVGTGGNRSSGGSMNGGSRSGGASGTGAGSGGESGSAGSEATGGSGGSGGLSGASGNAGQGGTGQGGGGTGNGGEGASGGESACQAESGDAECKECMRSSCCDAVLPCEADMECSDCVDCLDDVGDVGMCSSGAMTLCPLVSMEGATRDMLLCLLEQCPSECGFL